MGGGISNRQFGFRPRKTTSDAVLRVKETAIYKSEEQ